jgi:membrane protein implicated in regulation of membrane protease activity
MIYATIGVLHLVMPFTASYVGHLQMSVPARYRGRTIALVMLIMTVTATTIGPMSVAWFTDFVFGAPDKVGHSLAATCVLFVPLSMLLLVIGLPAARRAAAESEII